MSGWRAPSGGLIDRSKPIRFRWSGRTLTGFAGDTLASALLANGVSIVGRSFKYHRPRGLLAAGLEEPNAIVQIGEGASTVPNLKATMVELVDGLVAAPVNAHPDAEGDRMAFLGMFKRFIPAAFYYKTFMWPDWHWFEQPIRRAAGLGHAPTLPDPDRYESVYEHVDCLVIGGGRVGIAAAKQAAKEGRKVILVEADSQWGGRHAGDGDIAGLISGLGSGVNAQLRTMALGLHDDGLVSLVERREPGVGGWRERLWKVRALQIILATGAFERPLVCAGNDKPGVMLASAAESYARRFAVLPGRTIVLACNNDRAWGGAFALRRAGAQIERIIDARDHPSPDLLAAARAVGISVLAGCSVAEVKGRARVKAVVPCHLDEAGRIAARLPAVECDTLLVSTGFSPVLHLLGQASTKLRYDAEKAAFVAGDLPANVSVVGDAALTETYRIRPLWQVTDDLARPDASAFVDLQNDVTAADVALAHREAFRSVEHLKRYTTLGMATDQGKTSNVNGLAIMGELLGVAPGAVGTTRFRPPYDPTTMGAYAAHAVGNTLRPRRFLPAHDRHVALDATLEEYGGWTRPVCYPRGGENEHAAVTREALAVRNSVGLFDASPLGKIEVKGEDAATLLDRMYVGTVSTLAIGQCRYGLMLNEQGIVFDDGMVTRRAEDHFLVGTTSGHVGAVQANFQEWLQCEWVGLKVATINVTTCWTVMNIAGPRARDVLAVIDWGIDLSPEAFPHLSHRDGRFMDQSCRIQRVSFTGELSYEIAVPASLASALHAALMAAGNTHDITPFGIEALMLLRIEKGFLHIGSDTDGMTLPQDVGFGGPVSKKKSDFVGRRSCQRPDAMRPDRRQFVGLETVDGSQLPVGAHIVADGRSQGWVTSSILSPVLGRGHALAMIENGRARMGGTVIVSDMQSHRPARIVPPCAYDPGGLRQND